MEYELQTGEFKNNFGTTEGIKMLNAEARKNYQAMIKLRKDTINNPNLIGAQLFQSFDDLGKAITGDSNRMPSDYSQLFRPSISKSNRISAQDRLSNQINKLLSSVSNNEIDSVAIDKTQKLLQNIQFRNLITDGKPLFCNKSTPPHAPLKDYFDSKINSKLSQFLNEINIPQELNSKKSNNLSGWYGDPTVQRNSKETVTKATCVGHAIASNATAMIYKNNRIKSRIINKPIAFDPDYIYAAAQSNEQKVTSNLNFRPNVQQTFGNQKDKCNASRFNADFSEGIYDVSKAISLFQKDPLCAKVKGEDAIYHINKFSAVEFNQGELKPSFEVLKAMIDSGNPPMVGIDSDVRDEKNGWLRIKSRRKFSHIINVVGYDEGINPWTLCPTRYFIVRDSLGEMKIHYKVPADNLIDHINGMYSINEISRISTPNESDSYHLEATK